MPSGRYLPLPGATATCFASRQRSDRKVLVTRISAEVDLANVGHFKDVIQPALSNGRNVILDVRHLQYIDSTGLYVLAEAHKRLQQHNCRLIVVDASPTIAKVMRIFGLDGLVPMASSVDVAINLLW